MFSRSLPQAWVPAATNTASTFLAPGGTSSVVVGTGATLALTGTGGGIYNGTGTNNDGIYLNNAIITSSGASATTMTLTGLGG